MSSGGRSFFGLLSLGWVLGWGRKERGLTDLLEERCMELGLLRVVRGMRGGSMAVFEVVGRGDQ